MGHLLNDKSALVPLIDRLNRYPVGLVDSPRLRQILALLFDPREAEVAARFPLTEATPGRNWSSAPACRRPSSMAFSSPWPTRGW
jgi:hypothetical protein